jgi:hypothetical protein
MRVERDNRGTQDRDPPLAGIQVLSGWAASEN